MTPEAPRSAAVVLDERLLSDLKGGSNLLQSGFWGAFKGDFGWTPRGFRWRSGDGDGTILVLERRFPLAGGLAYVPHGPELPGGVDPAGVTGFLSSLAEALRPRLSSNCFVLRCDLRGGTRGPIARARSLAAPPGLSAPLKRAPYRVQPPDTVVVDLTRDDEAVLAGMHKKTRYNIRLAARKGVEVRRFRGEDAAAQLGRWYELYRQTGERDGIALHPERYYRRFLDAASKGGSDGPSVSLYLAEHDGELLAGIIVVRMGHRATYMYGASSDVKRELMPNHLLQWEAMRDARAEGAREFDLFGIPPADDPTHPMHGLWRFKTGFGGEIRHYYGAWDYPYRPLIYGTYRRAEALRGRLAAARKRRPR